MSFLNSSKQNVTQSAVRFLRVSKKSSYISSEVEEKSDLAWIYHEYENQSQVVFDESTYKNTLVFRNTHGAKIMNINNTLYRVKIQMQEMRSRILATNCKTKLNILTDSD
jgi:hypothetical protein